MACHFTPNPIIPSLTCHTASASPRVTALTYVRRAASGLCNPEKFSGMSRSNEEAVLIDC